MHAQIARQVTRPRAIAVATTLIVLAAGAVTIGSGSGSAASNPTPPTRQQLAKTLLDHHHDRFLSMPAQRALQLQAGVSGAAQPIVGTEPAGAAGAAHRPTAPAALAAPRAGLPNVRVNDPAADHFQTDQTTQSETSIAVSGAHVAVGFNDSQQALLAFTDGVDITGYAYSTDGGATFTDGGTLPNPLNFLNVGDPWLASDRAGHMFYGTLDVGGDAFNLEVGVARSDDGGRTWTAPAFASPNNLDLGYEGDKDAIATGRDPQVASRDDVYAAWDDFVFDFNTGEFFNGLPVAHSIDGGRTWSLAYADKITSAPDSCSFAQYIGALPIVNPANGTLFVAAEKIAVDDPACTGGTETRSEVVFRSTDGGNSFSPGVTIATVVPSFPTGLIELAPGQFIRNLEFPSLAIRGGRLYASWNDGASGRSHIRLATSANGGASWSLTPVTSGLGDEIQPAVSVDAQGLHIAYYQRNPNNTLDLVVSDSRDLGAHFSASTITSRSFPGVHTLPQFDPQIAPTYMGDYISNVSDGTHQYFAWGDNRDRLTNFTHPRGRNDPDVFFARR